MNKKRFLGIYSLTALLIMCTGCTNNSVVTADSLPSNNAKIESTEEDVITAFGSKGEFSKKYTLVEDKVTLSDLSFTLLDGFKIDDSFTDGDISIKSLDGIQVLNCSSKSIPTGETFESVVSKSEASVNNLFGKDPEFKGVADSKITVQSLDAVKLLFESSEQKYEQILVNVSNQSKVVEFTLSIDKFEENLSFSRLEQIVETAEFQN